MKSLRLLDWFSLITMLAFSLSGLWIVYEFWGILQTPQCYKDMCSVVLTDLRPLIYFGILFGVVFFVYGAVDSLRRWKQIRNNKSAF